MFVDFSAGPPRAGNAVIRSEACFFAGDHLALDAGGTVDIEFQVPPRGVVEEATLKIRALVSKLGPELGYAPLDVTLNDEPLLTEHRIPGGGDLPQETSVAVPASLLRAGVNTLKLRSADDSRSDLWLYRVLLESVHDRDGAERALLADAVRESVLAYETYRRSAGTDQWVPGPPLRVHIDSGEGGLPAQLAWRNAAGGEASVSFALELTTFYGHLRDNNGTWHELRGELSDRRAFPAGTEGGGAHSFLTEAGWGGRWHAGGQLVVFLDAGAGPFERISWLDQRGCSVSIGITDGGASFLGWSQRVNEGPVGYRGTARERRVGEVFGAAAIAPEAQVDQRGFKRAVAAAEERLAQIEEETT